MICLRRIYHENTPVKQINGLTGQAKYRKHEIILSRFRVFVINLFFMVLGLRAEPDDRVQRLSKNS
jgi:hypothetical protein